MTGAGGVGTLPRMFDDNLASRPSEELLRRRREGVFLVLAGLFIGSMTMLNILGVTRFLDLSFDVFGFTVPLPLAVGVLPYP
ncbi:MAG: hypothetical protein KDD47_09970, partial [Acidobacteria bacterium]|nr:hypothetical protein [Acidobacteriota bacterium]